MTDSVSRNLDPAARQPAFERLYAAHHRDVLAYCGRRASPADAWDATAEVFLVAWRRLDHITDLDNVHAWLFGVAYRVLANQRRSDRRRDRLTDRVRNDGDAATYSSAEGPIGSDEPERVREALGRLRTLDREILQLSLWEELTPAEIAAVLQISRAAVDQRYSRAKKRLARELGFSRSAMITTERSER